MEVSDHSFARDTAFFVALLATALALGGALAHAFELPNKIGMTRGESDLRTKKRAQFEPSLRQSFRRWLDPTLNCGEEAAICTRCSLSR